MRRVRQGFERDKEPIRSARADAAAAGLVCAESLFRRYGVSAGL